MLYLKTLFLILLVSCGGKSNTSPIVSEEDNPQKKGTFSDPLKNFGPVQTKSGQAKEIKACGLSFMAPITVNELGEGDQVTEVKEGEKSEEGEQPEALEALPLEFEDDLEQKEVASSWEGVSFDSGCEAEQVSRQVYQFETTENKLRFFSLEKDCASDEVLNKKVIGNEQETDQVIFSLGYKGFSDSPELETKVVMFQRPLEAPDQFQCLYFAILDDGSGRVGLSNFAEGVYPSTGIKDVSLESFLGQAEYQFYQKNL